MVPAAERSRWGLRFPMNAYTIQNCLNTVQIGPVSTTTVYGPGGRYDRWVGPATIVHSGTAAPQSWVCEGKPDAPAGALPSS